MHLPRSWSSGMCTGGWRAVKASRRHGFHPRKAFGTSHAVRRSAPCAGRGLVSARSSKSRLPASSPGAPRPSQLQRAARKGWGGCVRVCQSVGKPLAGRSRRAGTTRRSVANTRGDAVAHVPPERSGWRGSRAGDRGGGQGLSYTMANRGGPALPAASRQGAAERGEGGLLTLGSPPLFPCFASSSLPPLFLREVGRKS